MTKDKFLNIKKIIESKDFFKKKDNIYIDNRTNDYCNKIKP